VVGIFGEAVWAAFSNSLEQCLHIMQLVSHFSEYFVLDFNWHVQVESCIKHFFRRGIFLSSPNNICVRLAYVSTFVYVQVHIALL
jgi:hypothetical protein